MLLPTDQRLSNIEAGSSRLYQRDFLGLTWLADYVADVDTVCEAYERLRVVVIRENWIAGYAEGTVCHFCGVSTETKSFTEPFTHKDDCVVIEANR